MYKTNFHDSNKYLDCKFMIIVPYQESLGINLPFFLHCSILFQKRGEGKENRKIANSLQK